MHNIYTTSQNCYSEAPKTAYNNARKASLPQGFVSEMSDSKNAKTADSHSRIHNRPRIIITQQRRDLSRPKPSHPSSPEIKAFKTAQNFHPVQESCELVDADEIHKQSVKNLQVKMI
jgi:hypothetical protein